MRHGRSYRKLGRPSDHRIAMLRNLVESLFVSPSGRICTTVDRAKEARRWAEKMITLGKRESLHARRQAARVLRLRTTVRRLFDDVAPKFADRKGGYTRILRIGTRPGDSAEMAYLELVGIAEDVIKAKKASASTDKKDKAKAEEKKAAGADAPEGKTEPKTKSPKSPKPQKAKRDPAQARAVKPAKAAVKRASRAQKRGDS